MKIETVKTNACTMDYVRFGQGAEPLVILPGIRVQSVTGSWEAVAEAYRLLADRCTIYVYDGFGLAANDTAPDHRERMLRFLEA